MPLPFLTLILAHADLAVQQGHLARGALFLPEPEPLPEPFAEIMLRVETPTGASVELPARVLQILPGHGIAVAFDNVATAKALLAPLFAEPPSEEDAATFLFWGRVERKTTAPPAAFKAPPEPEPPPPPPPEPEADPVLPQELELDDFTKLEAEIAAMNTNQKMQLALRGDRTARMLLLKDLNKNIQTFIVQNPRITLEEVRSLAANRQANPDVLNTIAANKDWGNNPNVVIALVRNPKTPGGTAAKLLDKVPIAEVRRLAKANDVPPAVSAAAKRKVADGK
ncbi:MAG TPA: hypothetical protein VGI39_36580 [Polyangiaceae bacterium]